MSWQQGGCYGGGSERGPCFLLRVGMLGMLGCPHDGAVPNPGMKPCPGEPPQLRQTQEGDRYQLTPGLGPEHCCKVSVSPEWSP